MRKRLILFLTILLIPVLSIGPLSFAQNQAEDKGKSAKQSGTMSNQEEYPDHSAEPDRYQWLFDTPEAILSAPTEELLAFFLDSDFLTIDIITRSAPLQDGSLTDYSVHPAFAELIKRPDCLIAIENMAESAIREGDSCFPYAKVYALLMQRTVRELLDQQPVIRNRIYEILSEMITGNEKSQYDTPSFYVSIIREYGLIGMVKMEISGPVVLQ